MFKLLKILILHSKLFTPWKAATLKCLIILIFVHFVVIVGIIGCGEKPLFDELATNRLKVVLKGTYESNNPRPWNGNYPQDDSVDDFIDSSDQTHPSPMVRPDVFMLDIAELKIVDTTGNHQQLFANYRKTYTFPLNDVESFFNGTGVLYENDDIRPMFPWQYIKLYIRKMIFDGSKEYYLVDDDDEFNNMGEWIFNKNLESIFREETVIGFDFNWLQVNTYYDSLLNYYNSINRVFPMVISIEDGLIFDINNEATVLEIRIVIKNFLKKYEYDYYGSEDGLHYVRHYYALSDWLRDVKRDELVIGGNVLAVARTYVIGKTATLTGDAGINNCYVVAIDGDHDIGEYIAADRTRPGSDGLGVNEPKLPNQGISSDLESILEYHLKFEKYKEDYNNFVDCVDCVECDDSEACVNCDVCNSSEEKEYIGYEEGWKDYNFRLSSYKIPTLATWVEDSDNTFILENVPVGKTYSIYRSVNGNESGELPGDFELIGQITIGLEHAGQTLSVPGI
ncbi:MAG: hypothetical protein SVZ03_10625 [Spirochaetota bacterium]|nr:hypothetical protein [Spirochaetota bacterium]